MPSRGSVTSVMDVAWGAAAATPRPQETTGACVTTGRRVSRTMSWRLGRRAFRALHARPPPTSWAKMGCASPFSRRVKTCLAPSTSLPRGEVSVCVSVLPGLPREVTPVDRVSRGALGRAASPAPLGVVTTARVPGCPQRASRSACVPLGSRGLRVTSAPLALWPSRPRGRVHRARTVVLTARVSGVVHVPCVSVTNDSLTQSRATRRRHVRAVTREHRHSPVLGVRRAPSMPCVRRQHLETSGVRVDSGRHTSPGLRTR